VAETFYARVMTEWGNDVHLTVVPTQHRNFSLEGLRTLCNRKVFLSMDGTGDELSCSRCAKVERARPLRRRARWEGGLEAAWTVRKKQWKPEPQR